MKQNKGFTLIELLAVIVILAIIALIATPLVMSTINDAKKGSAINAAYGYINAVETRIEKEMVKDPSLNLTAGTFNGTVLTRSDSTTVSLVPEFKGTAPEEVNLTIANGAVQGGQLTINKFVLNVDEKGKVTAND